MVNLNLPGVSDQVVRDNLQKLQDFANALPIGIGIDNFQACELFVTENVSRLTIAHTLGAVPLDCIISRLVTQGAAKLIIRYSDFTNANISVDITGLTSGQTLSARLFIGTFSNVVVVGSVKRADSELQEAKGRF